MANTEWLLDEASETISCFDEHGERQILVYELGTNERANRMMVAAPDLLAALERCAIRLAATGHSEACADAPHSHCICGNTQAMEQARAAIAKAERGESGE